jgi:hypothetical protein
VLLAVTTRLWPKKTSRRWSHCVCYHCNLLQNIQLYANFNDYKDHSLCTSKTHVDSSAESRIRDVINLPRVLFDQDDGGKRRRRFYPAETKLIKDKLTSLQNVKWTDQDYVALESQMGNNCPNVHRKVASLRKTMFVQHSTKVTMTNMLVTNKIKQ